MVSVLKRIAEMQTILGEMEEQLGLSGVGATEKTVLIAIADLGDGGRQVSTKEILEHSLTSLITRASLFRALKKLEASGRINRSSEKRGWYMLASET